MDSFFSLFDPADSATTKPKKERRRGSRKADLSLDTARRKDQPPDCGDRAIQSDNTKHTFDQSEHCARRRSSQSDELNSKFHQSDSSRRKNYNDTAGNSNVSEDTVKRKSDQSECKKKKQSKFSSPRKNAHLPDESSFLCDPDTSTDVLVKDTSYIDSFIDYNLDSARWDERKVEKDGAPTEQKNPRRRNSGRKHRQKKSKISPPKDFIPKQCWNEENLFYPEYANSYRNNYARQASEEKITNWNNKSSNVRQKTPDNLGKNVNDLQTEKSVENDFDYGKKCRRKAEPFNLERQADGDLSEWLKEPQGEVAGSNVMDKLETANLQEELYLAGEFSDLDSNVFYSTDEEDTVDDSSSNMEEDSGDEVYGSLPPEPQLGNVEYKLKLAGVSDKRFQHLVTQLKWRLRSGGGSAVYVVGVRDGGALRGLRARALRASLHTLRRMAAALRATVRRVTARRVAPSRAVAEVYIRKLPDTQQSVELRVAVMGANEAGKSTLIGVLTQGELDNGRGSARLNMFRHVHEVRSGRTSSLSHEILGFDAQGCVVNYGCSELMTAERIEERSAKLVSFLDLAGHSKYQRTTVHGLTGYSPHYAMLVVSATAGINRMTEEHLGLLLALDLPFSVVVTKLDLAPGNMDALLARIQQILDAAECEKRPLLITNEHLAHSCAAPAETPLLDKLDVGSAPSAGDLITDAVEVVPVFPVSCVTGQGLNSLHGYLLGLEPPLPPPSDMRPAPEEEACEFQIDEIFRVGESCGPVVGGLLARGQLREGDHLLVGPLDTGDFVPITVKTIYRNRVPCGAVRAGQSASLGLSHPPPNLRQGMVLVAIPEGYPADDVEDTNDDAAANGLREEEFLDKNANPIGKNDISNLKNGVVPLNNDVCSLNNAKFGLEDGERIGLGKAKCESPTKTATKDKWDVKNFKRKEKNVLKELANVESSLAKDTKDLTGNLYKSDSDSDEVSSKPAETGLEPAEAGLRLDGSGSKLVSSDGSVCSCCEILLEDPNDPRGCLFFQATVRVLRHSTAIYPGFQATVHIGNIRQTAVIEGIMSSNSVLRSGESASVLFRFVRVPEYVRSGRKMLFRDGLETRGVGRLTQVFPYVPGH